MKIFYFIMTIFFWSAICVAQGPQVIVFKHELRWTDERKFPNYFLLPEVRDSIFYNTKREIMNYLTVSDVKFPNDVYYNIIPGFGKQKTEMPKGVKSNDPVIGIFSFITRATAGYAMFWKLKIIIVQNNKIIMEKEVNHELEYFNSSGYVGSQQWISPGEFQNIFNRLVSETLGFLPASNEKIVLGSLESIEEKVRSISPTLKRTLLKINGNWTSGGNFSALLESEDDTLLKFNFKEELLSGYTPSLAPLFASLFTDITGIDFAYDREIKRELNGTLIFSDDQKFGIRITWIETETKSIKSDDVITNISNPVGAELYDQKGQVGYFLYVFLEKVNETDKTTEKFNAFTGMQKENTLGIERIHRIKGSLSENPIFAEFNENKGIIMINSSDELLGVMVVQNCNPESKSIGGQKLSENKLFISSSGQNIKKPSMEDIRKVEWYPFYLAENLSDDSMKICIKTLICLFYGIGNMDQVTMSQATD